MKRTFEILSPCFAAALCLALQGAGTGLQAVGDEPQHGKRSQHGAEYCQADHPAAINKASSLLGMKVENEAGQSLGRIKDIVIDPQNERVSYAVLGMRSGFLGLRQKLLAVPFDAFRPGSDETHLVLNADRQSLEMAQGFTASEWPSPTAPSWGAAPPWKEGSDLTQSDTAESKSPKREAGKRSEQGMREIYPPGSLGYPGW